MDKVKLNVKEGKAVVEEGKDSFLGKVLAGKNVRLNTPLRKAELEVVEELPKKKTAKRVAKKK